MHHPPVRRFVAALCPFLCVAFGMLSMVFRPDPVLAFSPETVQGVEIAPISMSDPDGQEMILEALSVRTAVDGMLSLTELELRFRNPHPRRMEGRFTCVLPTGAAISRFAKEVNGRLMEGEVVEKLRANRIYDTILHEMRDPALLEQDQGNRFSARVFPIEANATVRLVLSYSRLMPLEDGVRTYTLPLRGLPTMGHFVFRGLFSSLPGEVSSDLEGKSRVLEGPSSARSSAVQVLGIDETDYTPTRDLEVRWRSSERKARVRMLRTGDFYLASFIAPQDLMPMASASSDSGARTWAFYVDTSASSAEGQLHRIEALEQLLACLPPSDRVELYAFDQEVVALAKGPAARMVQEVRPALEARKFLGGTHLETLFQALAAHARRDSSTRFVLATDGVATLGRTKPEELVEAAGQIPADVTLHALVLGARQDEAMLKVLTRGRGRTVSIPFTESLAQRAEEAAEKLLRPVGATVQLDDPAAEWLFPAEVDDVQPGSEVIAIGRLKPGQRPQTRLKLAGSVFMQVEGASALSMGKFEPLLEREGYRAYLDYLAEREAQEASPAVRQALATEQIQVSVAHRVLIPRTTLLVLESEYDYERFGLDRRALVSIMTVGPTGIEMVDRTIEGPLPITEPPRSSDEDRLVTKSKPKKRRLFAADDDDDEGPVRMAKMAFAPESDEDQVGYGEGGQLEDEGGASWVTEEMDERDGVEGEVLGGVMGAASGEGLSGGGGAAATGIGSVGIGSATGGAAEGLAVEGRVEGVTLGAAAPEPNDASVPLQAPRPSPDQSGSDEVALATTDKVALPEWVDSPVPSDEDVETLEAEIKANPRSRPAYNLLADAYFARGEWGDLRRLALNWQVYDPENPQVYESLGGADLRTERVDEAARAFASLVEIAPGKVALLQRAGLLLLRTEDQELAEAPLRRALELRPDRVNAYRHLAILLWQQGKLDEAAGILESALEKDFADWYKDVHRVVREELGYLYRAILAHEPDRLREIQARARERHVDLERIDALRVTLAWETDANDVDLHVVDPNGEECYYSHMETRAGLKLYEDITQGLGPEVVRADHLLKGTYHVGVNYFSAGPMGISRGLLVVIQPDADGQVSSVRILPFRLTEGGKDMRLLASIKVDGGKVKGRVTR